MDPGTFLETVPPFSRGRFPDFDAFTWTGGGTPGAKVLALAAMRALPADPSVRSFLPAICVDVPPLVVVMSDFFDSFLRENDLLGFALSGAGDEEIAGAFAAAPLPASLVADLKEIAAGVPRPLAVRSSRFLAEEWGGSGGRIRAARMIAGGPTGLPGRLESLHDAVRHVYASTFFGKARRGLEASGRSIHEEKMAVIVQEVVGSPHGSRFYPHISGLLRSFNFYPLGLARPEQGLVQMALGLGKSIVDEGVAWSYSPAHPHVNPPYAVIGDLLDQAQKEFWAVRTASDARSKAAGAADDMIRCSLREAEEDGVLRFLASTYKVQDDRIVPGVEEEGPRLLDFSPILKHGRIPLSDLLKVLLRRCEDLLGEPVEVEFAVTLPEEESVTARLGLLAARPMRLSEPFVDLTPGDLGGGDVLVASESVLGNGAPEGIRDIVYVRPDRFRSEQTKAIAREIEDLDRELTASARPYILIGFGRWGTTDPLCGIPVRFDGIGGAKVLVEAPLPSMEVMLSLGAHFFQRLIRSGTIYFSIEGSGRSRIDWAWLERQEPRAETRFLRHVAAAAPFLVRVDGRTGRGLIRHRP